MKTFNRDVRGVLIATTFATAFVVMAGCSSTAPAPKKEHTATVAKSVAAAPAAAKPVTAAPAQQSKPAATPASASADVGTVIFFRESKFMGGGVGFKVREGDKELGKLSNGSYFTAQVPAGPHEFTVHSEAKDVLNLEVEPGETYYIQGSISMGVLVGHPNLSPSSAEAFNALKSELKDSAAAKKKKS